MRIEITWQGGWYNSTTVFIIGILPSSFSIERKTSTQSTSAKNIGGREKPFEVGPPTSKKLSFIDAIAKSSRIQNLHICIDGFEFCILRHVDQPDSIQSCQHNLLHYKVKIWVINYPAVFTSFQRKPRILRSVDQDFSDKWCLNFSSQDILISTPLFPLEVGRKRKRRGHL